MPDAARTAPADAAPSPVRQRSALDLEAGCDFYCLRFRVWYRSIDCAYRTRFHSYEGCRSCEQGRFNLRRHAARWNGRGAPALALVEER